MDLPGCHLQRRIERQRPVAQILDAVTLRAASPQRQDRLSAIQGLNVALLIHAEHDGVRRRIEIETQGRRRFFCETGIGTGDVRVDAVRLEAVAPPQPTDRTLRDPVAGRHRATGPLRHRARRATLRVGQTAGFLAERDHSLSSRPRRILKAGEPAFDKPPFPVLHHARGQPHVRRRGADGLPGVEQQDRAGASRQSGFHGARAHQGFERLMVGGRELQNREVGHTCTIS